LLELQLHEFVFMSLVDALLSATLVVVSDWRRLLSFVVVLTLIPASAMLPPMTSLRQPVSACFRPVRASAARGLPKSDFLSITDHSA
jgi:hypothetical protein